MACKTKSMRRMALAGIATGALLAPGMVLAKTGAAVPSAQACAALAQPGRVAWPDTTTRIVAATWRAAGYAVPLLGQPDAPPVQAALPAHCEIEGLMHERRGVDGQSYAIRFRLRLPAQWNGRFLMQGGGGTNGTVGDAIGQVGVGQPFALGRGYAVLAQDSGHDNATNTDPARGGMVAFAHDPQARADYGGASLRPVTLAAKALVAAYYGRAPRFSYFYGCSKGGQEGMVLAQQEPDLYNGIVAAAPGFALPRAALAEAWNTKALGGVLTAQGQAPTVAALAGSFSVEAGAKVRQAILAACDGLDGASDGIVADGARCTSALVVPQLRQAGLSAAQVNALVAIHDGVRDSAGHQIYPGFGWDGGWFDPGWRIWMMGSADGRVPPLNVVLGAPSRLVLFATPPGTVPPAPDAMLAAQLAFSPDKDAAAITATAPGWPRSAWADVGAHLPNLDQFRARGGRLIVPHGASDPVFSLNDTLAWWRALDRHSGGQAAGFARVFPVPGMAHCAGGPATDRFDAFRALVRWVEQGQAPQALQASAGPATPWPGRTRPLCRYPLVAKGKGGAPACVMPKG
ncbi:MULTISPECIES: tannase/feruloyl esterase family alpha/beta hydrolase [unclassified Novosphingobium]|uniref:tannase/feruloyl esterase family alpha/beta hydrolase n=1 Tax=unclassified Novosphingobium TaxID=2644732 RepID=UPI00146E3D4A|nr:feruloyl esterase [Novosphingobium sp. SG919]NMN87733.1 feruloyl esterase [Novosphingobium sp. SG916]